jgi:hypothetical protein
VLKVHLKPVSEFEKAATSSRPPGDGEQAVQKMVLLAPDFLT